MQQSVSNPWIGLSGVHHHDAPKRIGLGEGDLWFMSCSCNAPFKVESPALLDLAWQKHITEVHPTHAVRCDSCGETWFADELPEADANGRMLCFTLCGFDRRTSSVITG